MNNIESLTKEQATVLAEKETDHYVHLILAICTMGIWIPVWLIVTLYVSINRERGKARLVDLQIKELNRLVEDWY